MQQLANTLQNSKTIVVYPCAGSDWKAITFTTPQFLKYRTGLEFKTPDTYIYIDCFCEEYYKKQLESKILFDDEYTRLQIESVKSLSSSFGDAKLCKTKLISKKQPSWSEEFISDRDMNIIFVDSDWVNFVQFMSKYGVMPYIGIGVTDGCAFGKNKECVNDLKIPKELRSISHKAYKEICSEYWITDHFSHCRKPNPCRNGDYIVSEYDDFPIKFKKLALLSSSWGGYGRWTDAGGGAPLRGGTIFSIERA